MHWIGIFRIAQGLTLTYKRSRTPSLVSALLLSIRMIQFLYNSTISNLNGGILFCPLKYAAEMRVIALE